MWLMMGEVCETTNIAALENQGEKEGKIGKLDLKLQPMPLRICNLRTRYVLQCKVGQSLVIRRKCDIRTLWNQITGQTLFDFTEGRTQGFGL